MNKRQQNEPLGLYKANNNFFSCLLKFEDTKLPLLLLRSKYKAFLHLIHHRTYYIFLCLWAEKFWLTVIIFVVRFTCGWRYKMEETTFERSDVRIKINGHDFDKNLNCILILWRLCNDIIFIIENKLLSWYFNLTEIIIEALIIN